MNKATMTLAMIIVLGAVFALATPVDTAIAETDAMPHGEEYGDGEQKDGKTCPFKGKMAEDRSS